MPNIAYLGLGSNEGDRAALLEQAIALLAEKAGAVVSRSSILETEPWGFASDHRFLNMVVAISTPLSPTRLLDVTQRIERQLGRKHKTTSEKTTASPSKRRYQDRPIDIDILLYGDERVDTPDLQIPHPLMREREFIMRPLEEIFPQK